MNWGPGALWGSWQSAWVLDLIPSILCGTCFQSQHLWGRRIKCSRSSFSMPHIPYVKIKADKGTYFCQLNLQGPYFTWRQMLLLKGLAITLRRNVSSRTLKHHILSLCMGCVGTSLAAIETALTPSPLHWHIPRSSQNRQTKKYHWKLKACTTEMFSTPKGTCKESPESFDSSSSGSLRQLKLKMRHDILT